MLISELKTDFLYLDSDGSIEAIILCVNADLLRFKDIEIMKNDSAYLIKDIYYWKNRRKDDYKDVLTLIGHKDDHLDLFI